MSAIHPLKAKMPAPVFLVAAALAGCAIALSFSAAHAAQTERTPGGIVFLQGGIGADEVADLEGQRTRWPLQVRTAARGSGAWLTDVHLTIRDADDHKVFDRQMDGPFLLIDLPPGRYDVVGVHDGEVTRQAVTIPEHGHRESMLYFPVEGEVAPHHNGED